MFTEGVNCGDGPMNIDIGGLWFDLGGDTLLLFSGIGVRGAVSTGWSEPGHGDLGRGRSKEVLTGGAVG